jgi:16S rRNA (guanine527-N7)-methyltransferase
VNTGRGSGADAVRARVPDWADSRWRDALNAAADRLALPLDDGQAGRLLAYLAMLQRWTRVYNLTALRRPEDMWTHHLLDCLAVVQPLRRLLVQAQPVVADVVAGPGLASGSSAPLSAAATLPRLQVLDVGSGGGLPGVVLAILNPGWDLCCVDAVAKKASFVRQVAVELPLPNLVSRHARVEALAAEDLRYQGITSRAFASLADMVQATNPLLADGGVWMAMKGKVPTDEFSALGPEVEVFHVEQLTVPGLAAERCLVGLRRRTC